MIEGEIKKGDLFQYVERDGEIHLLRVMRLNRGEAYVRHEEKRLKAKDRVCGYIALSVLRSVYSRVEKTTK